MSLQTWKSWHFGDDGALSEINPIPPRRLSQSHHYRISAISQSRKSIPPVQEYHQQLAKPSEQHRKKYRSDANSEKQNGRFFGAPWYSRPIPGSSRWDPWDSTIFCDPNPVSRNIWADSERSRVHSAKCEIRAQFDTQLERLGVRFGPKSGFFRFANGKTHSKWEAWKFAEFYNDMAPMVNLFLSSFTIKIFLDCLHSI